MRSGIASQLVVPIFFVAILVLGIGGLLVFNSMDDDIRDNAAQEVQEMQFRDVRCSQGAITASVMNQGPDRITDPIIEVTVADDNRETVMRDSFNVSDHRFMFINGQQRLRIPVTDFTGTTRYRTTVSFDTPSTSEAIECRLRRGDTGVISMQSFEDDRGGFEAAEDGSISRLTLPDAYHGKSVLRGRAGQSGVLARFTDISVKAGKQYTLITRVKALPDADPGTVGLSETCCGVRTEQVQTDQHWRVLAVHFTATDAIAETGIEVVGTPGRSVLIDGVQLYSGTYVRPLSEQD